MPLADDVPVPVRGSAVCVGAPVAPAAPPDGVVGAGAISAGELGNGAGVDDAAAIVAAGVVVADSGVLVAITAGEVAATGVKVAGTAVSVSAGVDVAAACTMIVPVICVGCTRQWYVYVPGTVNVTGPNENGDA